MKNILLVPIQTDALFLSEDTLMTEASADFSHLPYFNGTRDVNADVANISENVVSQPLQDQNLRLRKGLHLHWALPDAMNKGRHLENGRTDFPAAPNRWVVEKFTHGINTGRWVVQSDYLFPEDKDLKGNEKLRKERRESITVPIKISGRESGEQPFRYMGRKMNISSLISLEYFAAKLNQLSEDKAQPQNEWNKMISFGVIRELDLPDSTPKMGEIILKNMEEPSFSAAANSAENFNKAAKVLRRHLAERKEAAEKATTDKGSDYYPKLTTVGYGEPTFAAFYPNCRSVFGFHDPDIDDESEAVTYKIYGWYDNADNDCYNNLNDRSVEVLLSDFVRQLPDLTVEKAEDVWIDLMSKGVLDDSIAEESPAERALIRAKSTWNVRSINTPPHRMALEYLEELLEKNITERARWNVENVFTKEIIIGAFKDERGHEWAERLVESEWLHAIEGQPELFTLPPVSERNHKAVKVKVDIPDQALDTFFEVIRGWTPKQVVLHSQIEVDTKGKKSDVPRRGDDASKIEGLSVVIGKTGTEALCAYLANRLGKDHEITQITEQLESLFLLDKLDHRVLDVDAKFDEARHENGFNALTSGHLWTIAIESELAEAANAPAQTERPELSEELAKELNQLNALQWKYDRARDEWASLGKQLFTDWYKYMMATYPPEDSRIDHPDIDEVRYFIETKVMQPLQEKAALAGELILAKPEEIRAGNNPARGKGGASNSLGKQVAKHINSISKKLALLNIDSTNPNTFILKRIGGPRFYEPKEPVVLLVNPDKNNKDLQPTLRHGQDGRLSVNNLLTCHSFIFSHVARDYSLKPEDFSQMRPILDLMKKKMLLVNPDRTPLGFYTWKSKPWNPFRMDWEIEIVPLNNGTNMDKEDYDPNFLMKKFEFKENDNTYQVQNFRLPVNSPDLEPQDQKIAHIQGRNPNIYSGKSLLTPQAKRSLKERLKAYINEVDAEEGEKPPQYVAATKALALINNEDFHLLSQSLSGFNDALLQYRQSFQMPIADPIGFLDYQPFTEEVARLAAHSTHLAPQPLTDFNPIINGKLSINELWLVDTFGQKRQIDLKQLDRVVGADWIQPQSEKENSILEVPLQPRLPQPSRINFRWLNARDGDTEMNALPDTSPICGWFLTNQLDDSLMVFDASGQMLGSIEAEPDLNHETLAKWNPAPGAKEEIFPDDISNEYLKRTVDKIISGGVDFVDGFIDQMNGVLSNIEPEEFESQQALSLLIGRPVAVVRASVNLELQGEPAVDQGWHAFYIDREEGGFDRQRDGFTKVKFPVRLGEYNQFNDGLVGYWKEANGEFDGDFLINQIGGSNQAGITFLDDDVIPFEQSIDSAPQLVTMLIDPRANVHVTTGILPVKEITIPPNQYLPAMQRMCVTFLTAPLLTPSMNIQSLLPTVDDFGWSWLERSAGESWREVLPTPNIDRGHFLKAFADKILVELENATWVRQFDGNSLEFLPEEEHQIEHFTDRVDEDLFGILDEISRDHDGLLVFDKESFKERVSRKNDLGGSIWNLLVRSDVTWCQFIPDRPETFVILPVTERSSNELPEFGLESMVESILKENTQILTEPLTSAHFSAARMTIREGYLKLRTE